MTITRITERRTTFKCIKGVGILSNDGTAYSAIVRIYDGDVTVFDEEMTKETATAKIAAYID